MKASEFPRRVLRYPELRPFAPYSRQHLYRLEKAGLFPQHVKLGRNSIGWYEDEVHSWQNTRQRGAGPAEAA